MMRVVLVCGAGASSTFGALHLRRAAARSGADVTVAAGALDTLGDDGHDVILLGAHLAPEQPALAERYPASVVVLLDGTVTADNADNILARALAAGTHSAADGGTSKGENNG